MVFTYAGLYGPELIFDTTTGQPAPSATITVLNHGTNVSSSLYKDKNRAQVLTNPVPTGVSSGTAGQGLDTHGNLSFYANPGVYDLSIHIGLTTTVVEVEIEADPDEIAAAVGLSVTSMFYRDDTSTTGGVSLASGTNPELPIKSGAATISGSLLAVASDGFGFEVTADALVTLSASLNGGLDITAGGAMYLEISDQTLAGGGATWIAETAVPLPIKVGGTNEYVSVEVSVSRLCSAGEIIRLDGSQSGTGTKTMGVIVRATAIAV